jgi:hypothetical protein
VPVISALRRLRQEELEFKTNLVFIARPCLKKKKKGKNTMVCVFNMHFLPCPQGKHKGCRCESDKDTGLMKCPPRLSGCPLTLEKAQGPQLQYSAYV